MWIFVHHVGSLNSNWMEKSIVLIIKIILCELTYAVVLTVKDIHKVNCCSFVSAIFLASRPELAQ